MSVSREKPKDGDASISEALASSRKSERMDLNPSRARKWNFRFFGLNISMPNFSWRKKAIDRHDLHHLLIDQPFTMAGECQVATWEFAAGAFPDKRAQFFCLPLVALGTVTAPKRTWMTYKYGARCQSLYSEGGDKVSTLEDARNFIHIQPTLRKRVYPGFLRLVTASSALYLIPIILAATIGSEVLF